MQVQHIINVLFIHNLSSSIEYKIDLNWLIQYKGFFLCKAHSITTCCIEMEKTSWTYSNRYDKMIFC